MLAEQQTEWIINNNLVNKGWNIDGNSSVKNVYFQKPPFLEQQKKLKGKKPDYILYQTATSKPIAIIEAKAGHKNLDGALKQGIEYAEALNVPLVFAMNGGYCETCFVPNRKSLILNGDEVRELIREKEVLEFLSENTNEVWTIPKEVKVSRDELIKQFGNLNDVLRSEGLRAGIERFSEFSNILFLKLLSENNEKSWWKSIKNQSDDDIILYINNIVIQEIQTKYGGDVFTPISIRNPQTLRHIIDVIDPLVLSTIDTDIKGDAFEYFLEKTTSTENDLGEYFTPRNVVKTIINLIDPKFKETVYDPFCGTGGFLTEAFNHMKENNIIEGEDDLKRLKYNTLYGGEITTNARIAKMNMILHGDGHSGIKQINSLENPDYKDSITNTSIKFDVIVTNMPFSQPITRKISDNGKTKIENYISPLYYNGLAKNNGDAVCILHCLRNLKEGGRMALVVPEGFLFRKDVAKVREFLLSKVRLQSVISLPQGTFAPYTGVKTDILYFTDAHKTNNQKKYWFFETKNIGVTLDNNKRKIKGMNDFNKIDSSDIKKVDKNPELKENMLEVGFEMIDLEKVRNNYYNLVGSVYREIESSGKYKMVKVGEVVELLNGYAFNSDYFSDSEGFPLIRIRDIKTNSTKTKYNHEVYDKKYIVNNNDIIIGMDGEFNIVIWKGEQALLNQRVCKVIPSNKVLKEYLYYAMKKPLKNIEDNTTFTTVKHISSKQILHIKIPLPSLKVQKQIVDKIENKKNKIRQKKQEISKIEQDIRMDLDNIWTTKSDIA